MCDEYVECVLDGELGLGFGVVDLGCVEREYDEFVDVEGGGWYLVGGCVLLEFRVDVEDCVDCECEVGEFLDFEWGFGYVCDVLFE